MARTPKTKMLTVRNRSFRRTIKLDADTTRIVNRWGRSLQALLSIEPTAIEIQATVYSLVPKLIGSIDTGLRDQTRRSHQDSAAANATVMTAGDIQRVIRSRLGLPVSEGLLDTMQAFWADVRAYSESLGDQVLASSQRRLQAIIGRSAADAAYAPSEADVEFLAKTLIFPPLAPDKITSILKTNYWGDGLTWDDRIRGMGRYGTDFSDIAQSLETGIANAAPQEEMVRDIRRWTEEKNWKARRIVRTESQRVALQGNREAQDSISELLEGRQLVAVMDDRTRDDHAYRSGRIYELDQVTGEYIYQGRGPSLGPGETGFLPAVPDAPNCVLPGTIVDGEFCGGLKAWYSGEAFEIHAGCHVLRVTANHRILTDRGFIPAREVVEGDEALGYILEVGSAPAGPHHKRNKPATVEQVLRAFSMSIVATDRFMLDLHGDERSIKGDVEIIGAARKLMRAGNSHDFEQRDQLEFKRAGVERLCEASGSSGSFDSSRVGTAAASRPGGGKLTFNAGGVLLNGFPFCSFGLGLGPVLRTVFNESSDKAPWLSSVDAPEAAASHAKLFRKLVHALTGIVAPCKISKVEGFEWDGHVFDLQSSTGIYNASGIITHNCRCIDIPVFIDVPPLHEV